MGEILRAVLQQSAQFSRPRFYSARLAIPAGLSIGQSRSTVTTFDTFGYFLLTAFYVAATQGQMSGGPPWGLTSFTEQMKLQDMQTGKFLFLETPDRGGPVGSAIASLASSPLELTQYPFFEPGERIRFIYTINSTFPTTENYIDVCYSGIEYLIASGGAANGSPPT